MGVGTPDDMLEAVARGIDMFDCVMPTRAGRHGQIFTRFGRMNLKNAKHADDPRPIDPQSSCQAANGYARAYLHHLVKAEEMLGKMLLTWVNLAYYQELMAGLRAAIAAGSAPGFHRRDQGRLGAGRYHWRAGVIDPWLRPAAAQDGARGCRSSSAARCWPNAPVPMVAAMIATLPISAGPVYVFLALEHEPAFIAAGALGSMSANLANTGLSLVYVLLAQRWGTLLSLGAALRHGLRSR
jgi:hypothetical protein